MEIKAPKTRPDWLNGLIKEFGLKCEPFSKYCYGVETLYLNESNQFDRRIQSESNHVKGVNDYVGIHNELNEYFPVA